MITAASGILEHARARVGRPRDPWFSTAVLVYGQICIAVDERHRLIGVGINNPEAILVAVCGQDEYRTWQVTTNERQKRRRARARERAA